MLCGGVIISLQQEVAARDRSPGSLFAQEPGVVEGGGLFTAAGR